MKPLNVYCCTWNVGDTGPPNDDLSLVLGIQSRPLPDIIYIGLQEVANPDDWYEAFKRVLAPLDFVLVKMRNCWAICIYAFVKRNLLPATTNIESEVTVFGYAGIMGNKGACSIRMEVCGVNMACISAHFTSHCEYYKDRINDYLDVIRNQTFRDPDVNVILDHDYVFWMGDLNFRLEGITKEDVEEIIAENALENLYGYDQLLKAMRDDLIFQDFREGQISFPPTFKFDKGTNTYDTSKKKRVPSYTDRVLYMAHDDFALNHNVTLDNMGRKIAQKSRNTPVRGSPAKKQQCSSDEVISTEHPRLRLLEYNSLPDFLSSDHKPVFARFEASIPNSWFELPIRFLRSKDDVQKRDEAMIFLYTILDPPPLNSMEYSEKTFRNLDIIDYKDNCGNLKCFPESRSQSSHELRRNNPASSSNLLGSSLREGKYSDKKDKLTLPCSNISSSVGALSPCPPNALEVDSWDWIAIFPSTFYDFSRDYLTSIYASKTMFSTSSSFLEWFTPTSSKKDPLDTNFPEAVFNSPVIEGKFDASVLSKIKNSLVQLVYMSRRKNCPQGYSEIINLTE